LPGVTRGLLQILTLHVICPWRTPSRSRLVNVMKKVYLLRARGCDELVVDNILYRLISSNKIVYFRAPEQARR
jgi:hypothetical protein